MRIARVVTRLNLGGPARQVLASDPQLIARGHDLRVFTGSPEPGEGDLSGALIERGVDVVRVPGLARGGGPAVNLGAWRFLRRELRAFDPDLVHTHASKAGLLGRTAAPRGAVCVHTFHGHVLEGYFGSATSRALALLEARLARRCARLIAVSAATRDDLVRLGVAPSSAIELSPPGLDLERYLEIDDAHRRSARARLELDADGRAAGASTATGTSDTRLTIGFVGRLAQVKRPELAGAIVAGLREGGIDAELVVAGDGPQRDALCAAMGAHRDALHLLGAVEDPFDLHAACDLVLCTSRNEGLPVALIEAAAAARAVVATDVGGIGELVEDGVTGALIDGSDPVAEGVKAIAALVHDPRARTRMGERARERVAARHGATALADRLEGIYSRSLEAAGRGNDTHTEVERCAS